MMYRAITTFGGVVSMRKGEEKAISDKAVADDLVRARYVEEVKEEKKSKKPPKG